MLMKYLLKKPLLNISQVHVTPDMPMPNIDGINDLLKEDIKQYGMWLEQIVYNAVGSRLIAAEDYYDAGVKYMEFARYKEAIEMFETAINMKPVFPDAINTLGVCYTKTEEYPEPLNFTMRQFNKEANTQDIL